MQAWAKHFTCISSLNAHKSGVKITNFQIWQLKFKEVE